MGALILEIKTRGLHQYHALDGRQIRIGRALDNDVILSDPTVAPYHLQINFGDDDELQFENLTAINPARVNGKIIGRLHTSQLPVDIELGRISARLISRQEPVPEARSIAGNGRNSFLFGQMIWVIVLLLACVLVTGMDYYLNAYTTLKWDGLVKFVLREALLSIAVFVFALSILERLLVNRWEIKSIFLAVGLVYLSYHLLVPVMKELQYILSSNLPLAIFQLGWFLFIVPLAVSLYLVYITHLNRRKSILLAFFIASPIAFLAVVNNSLFTTLATEFRSTAYYQRNLSALNWHLRDTVSIDDFIAQAKTLKSGQFVD